MVLKCLIFLISLLHDVLSQIQNPEQNSHENKMLELINIKNISQPTMKTTKKNEEEKELSERGINTFDCRSKICDKKCTLHPNFGGNPEGSMSDRERSVDFDRREGEEAYNITDSEDHPYAVLVLSIVPEEEIITCSGSLLTMQWVLTAAHCVDGVDRAWVYAGGRSTREVFDCDSQTVLTENLPEGAQVLRGDRLIVHPDFPTSADIGLIRVEGFSASSAVNTVPLSTRPWNTRGYRSCAMTGYGAVDVHGENEDHFRKTLVLDVKRPCLCSFVLGLNELLSSNNVLCSKPRQHQGLCKGDSGGGLVCDGELHAIGLAVYTFVDIHFCDLGVGPQQMECGGRDSLSVFQTLYRHLSWVDGYVQLLNDTDLPQGSESGSSVSSGMPFIEAVLIHSFSLTISLFFVFVISQVELL